MLYYIQHCRNECHVVVTTVTPGRDIAMQGHSQAARPAVLGWCSQVSVPRWAAPKIYTTNHPTGASALNPTGCQPHWGNQCQQAGELCTSESLKNILGYMSCPLSYAHWSLWWSQAERLRATVKGLGSNTNWALLWHTMLALGLQACAEGERRALPKNWLQGPWSQQQLLPRSSVSAALVIEMTLVRFPCKVTQGHTTGVLEYN